MSELSELNRAIRDLSDLWAICTDDDQCEALLNKRDELDRQAGELANLIIHDGSDELGHAIISLNELSASATTAKQEIDNVAEKIRKTAKVIDKATKAIGKVASLIAKL